MAHIQLNGPWRCPTLGLVIFLQAHTHTLSLPLSLCPSLFLSQPLLPKPLFRALAPPLLPTEAFPLLSLSISCQTKLSCLAHLFALEEMSRLQAHKPLAWAVQTNRNPHQRDHAEQSKKLLQLSKKVIPLLLLLGAGTGNCP